MAEIHAGAAVDRPPNAQYVGRLDFAELTLRPPFPRTKTLVGVRKKLPDRFRLAFAMPRSAIESKRGPLRFDEELDATLTWALEAARALAADFLVVSTSSAVTTSRRDRELIAKYLERCAQSQAGTVVWVPTGLWEPDEAATYASEMGVLCGFDPRASTPPSGDVLYARMRGVGGYQRLTDTILERVHEVLGESEAHDAYVVIDSSRGARDAARLAKQIKTASSEGNESPLVDELGGPSR